MSYTSKLARFVIETNFDDLPKEVIEKAKYVILDTLAASLNHTLETWASE
jgi:2-methylcitrate dehydratase PrpD